ncbi:MAG TPA: hypothetical protein VN026_13940 [Bacteroidia bacterium]|jgi:hypothetical protein|nr:hypothetical protein [Bacteroidia bacterium]
MAAEDTNKDLVISYLTMRKAVGWLGMLLPFILLFGNKFINSLDVLNSNWVVLKDCYDPYTAASSFKSSISHYYYSTVGELFTGTLCAVALFMFCYKGHKKRKGEKGLSDSAMTNLAGFFALGVVIFPTSSDFCITDSIRTFLSSSITGNIHYSFAALFFITLAVMSMVNFRRSANIKDFGKGKYDYLYLWFGMGMICCLVLIGAYKIIKHYTNAFDFLHPVFCLEAVALICFGLSWLKKGKVDIKYVPRMLKLID